MKDKTPPPATTGDSELDRLINEAAAAAAVLTAAQKNHLAADEELREARRRYNEAEDAWKAHVAQRIEAMLA
jgi:DNA-binding transcriptional MocR family regulator